MLISSNIQYKNLKKCIIIDIRSYLILKADIHIIIIIN